MPPPSMERTTVAVDRKETEEEYVERRRKECESEFQMYHVELSQALEVIWLCIGRDNISDIFNQEEVKEALDLFQRMRDASVKRRSSFSSSGGGSIGSGKGEYRVREWMKVVEMEKSDLGRAMDVVSVVVAK